MITYKPYFLLIIFIFTPLLALSLPGRAQGLTIVPESITTDTVWTKENGPYLIKDTIVRQSATLTISEGTKVVFEEPELYSLEVRGNLRIQGRKDSPVEFSGSPEGLLTVKKNSNIEHANFSNIRGLNISHGVSEVISSKFSNDSSILGEYSTTTLRSVEINNDMEFSGRAIEMSHSNIFANDLHVNGGKYDAVYLQDTNLSMSSSTITGRRTSLVVAGGSFDIRDSIISADQTAVKINNTGNLFPVFNQVNNVAAITGKKYTGGIGNALENDEGTSTSFLIHDSSIVGRKLSIDNQSDQFVNATENWWGRIIPHGEENILVQGKVIWDPALTTDLFGPKCCSNLIFIPGIQGSRLYEGNNRLWEPNRNADVEKLVMSGNVKNKVVVGGIIDKAYGLDSKPIYQPIIDIANQLVAQGTIKFWQPLPYDWRLPPDGLSKSLYKTILQAATTSPTGKVSIIAHSYGGLVAKSIIKDLESVGKVSVIDKVLLISSPEYGAAKTLPSLLHGYDQGILNGLLLSQTTARRLGQSIPSSHSLLPSDSYFDSFHIKDDKGGKDLVTSVIANFFSDIIVVPGSENRLNVKSINRQVASTGDLISLFSKISNNFKKYFGEPNLSLLGKAVTWHDTIDNYTLPPSIQLVRIASHGIPTLISTLYKNSNHCFLKLFLPCNTTLNVTGALLKNGDGTVGINSYPVASSSIYMDLEGENKKDKNSIQISHANITGSKGVQAAIENFAKDKIPVRGHLSAEELRKISEFLSYERPTEFSPLYTVSIHSPVDLKMCDTKNRCTEVVNPDPNHPELTFGTEFRRVIADIPGSDYFELAESKNIVADVYNKDGAAAEYDIILTGTDTGVATIEISAGAGLDPILPTAIIKDFSVEPGTSGRIKLNADILRNKSITLELYDQTTTTNGKYKITGNLNTKAPEVYGDKTTNIKNSTNLETRRVFEASYVDRPEI